MLRLYEAVARKHFEENRQMLFLSGPRQVGKTTSARALAGGNPGARYFTWDNPGHAELILKGPDALAREAGLLELRDRPPLIILDEVHKYRGWKGFLKGFFDTYPESARVLVMGSARLDVFKAGGDSLSGRYFPYRMHPLSLAELLRPEPRDQEIDRDPPLLPADLLPRLLEFGGFPEPFARGTRRFHNQWVRLRRELLFREELRDLTRVQELRQMEVLAELLRGRVGQLTSYSSLARDVRVAVDTVRRWLAVLSSFYYCFPVHPWFRNITRALRKEPKYYVWDWSGVPAAGARVENLVACALLKAVHFWTDHGLGEYELHFIRDKQQREVDFLVTRDGQPWFLAEVKSAARGESLANLAYFQEQSGAQHAFMVGFDLPPVRRDCFSVTHPVAVPAATFLAQLV